jgi:hypothetical protein
MLFVVHFTVLSIYKVAHSALNVRTSDDLRKIWKGAIVAPLEYYLEISLTGLRMSTKNLLCWLVFLPRFELITSEYSVIATISCADCTE